MSAFAARASAPLRRFTPLLDELLPRQFSALRFRSAATRHAEQRQALLQFVADFSFQFHPPFCAPRSVYPPSASPDAHRFTIDVMKVQCAAA